MTRAETVQKGFEIEWWTSLASVIFIRNRKRVERVESSNLIGSDIALEEMTIYAVSEDDALTVVSL